MPPAALHKCFTFNVATIFSTVQKSISITETMTPPLQQLQGAARLSNLAVNHFEHKDFIPAVGKLSKALGEVKRLIKEIENTPPSAAFAKPSRDGIAVCLLHRRVCHQPVLTTDQDTVMEDHASAEERHLPHTSSSSRRSDNSSFGEPLSGSPAHPLASSWIDDSRLYVHHSHCCGDNPEVSSSSWAPHQEPFAAEEGRPFIYDIPFHISEEALCLRSVDHDLLSEISVAILFNLALCHHMRVVHYRTSILRIGAESNRGLPGTQEEEDAATIRLVFQQALLLYGLAYDVQLHKHFELSPECTMAIANNMGLIYQEMGETTKASECFSRLLSTLLYIGSNASSNSEYYGHEGERHSCEESKLFTDGFIHSVSHLILKKQTAEAA
jgi:hypothetical protein